MKNGPKLWHDLISQAPKGSVLMGGAIVDYIAGVEPADYDIFHTYKIGEPMGLPPWWVKTEVHFNDPNWAEEHQKLYMQGMDGHGNHPIGSVYEYLVDGKYKVQLVGVHYPDPKHHFKNFDHSLTLGRYTKHGLFVHKKVFESIENQWVEYVSADKTKESVQRSLKRAGEKVEKYGWVDPIYMGFKAAFKANKIPPLFPPEEVAF